MLVSLLLELISTIYPQLHQGLNHWPLMYEATVLPLHYKRTLNHVKSSHPNTWICSHSTDVKRHRAAGPDDISPSLLKDGGDALITHLTHLCESIWKEETVPEIWGESIKKGARNECSIHRGISLTPVITRLLASTLRRRLLAACESTTREQQAGSRPGRGCIDHIFTLRQVLEQSHVYRRPTISIFLDFKGAFDSVDRSVLMDTLIHEGVPGKFVRIISSLYRSTTGRVRVYGELSESFSTTSGVRQGCPLSSFPFQLYHWWNIRSYNWRFQLFRRSSDYWRESRRSGICRRHCTPLRTSAWGSRVSG